MLFTSISHQTGSNPLAVCLPSPRCAVLGNIPGTELYKDRKDYKNVSVLWPKCLVCRCLVIIFCSSASQHFCSQIMEPYGLKIFKIPSPIFFANIEFFKDKLIEAVSI